MKADQLKAQWSKGLSDLEIASELGCSVATVCRARCSLKLPANSKKARMSGDQSAQVLALLADGLPLKEISEQTEVFVETIRKLANRKGVDYARSERRTTGKEVHGTLGYGGYVELRVDLSGPYGNLVHHGGKTTGYAPLHRMRMQDKLGRPLQPGEIVHHVDGDIYNNSPANLELFSSHTEHLDHHRKTRIRRCKEAADRQ